MTMRHLPSITLGPQVEAFRLDLRVQLRQASEESLQDFPSSFGSEIGGIFYPISLAILLQLKKISLTDQRGIDYRVAALDTGERSVFKGAGNGVKRTIPLFGV
jgi:hypothetical protein